ncbi:MAG: hypothetical protein WBB27_15155 [Maribacter sp.]
MFVLLVFFALLIACRQSPTATSDLQDSQWTMNASELPGKSVVNAKATAILKNWNEFAIFETAFDRLYTIEYREDLILVTEDLVEKQKLLEKSVYPPEFDIPQIKGRQKVLKTYILKMKGDLEYRVNPDASLKEIIKAFNALREQFNIVVNNTLSEDLILNEKK